LGIQLADLKTEGRCYTAGQKHVDVMILGAAGAGRDLNYDQERI
jgi:hypothetical protein